ncbi:response regulator transcription factor [Taibaiella lutea]|uniref:Response regulator transcription factor n=1 Tax=Taibaiella lutea TaxID=2608001 RepID=A0A5M6CMB7_9BACT|nr:response regulator transcription factor [Taibaiella lutea]
MIEAFQPDLVFLDIEMPNENGLHFLERIFPFNFEVVFVTAYDTFAVKAFRLNALDYIMKPIDIDYLQDAINKVAEKLVFKNLLHPKEIINQNTPDSKIEKMFFRTENSMELVEISQIIYISADWSYTNIFYLKNQQINKITMSYSIAKYDQQLSSHSFYRIHKSYLVNIAFVEKIIKDSNTMLQLSNDIKLPISRRKYAALLSFMAKK